jgi:hypothetical protein
MKMTWFDFERLNTGVRTALDVHKNVAATTVFLQPLVLLNAFGPDSLKPFKQDSCKRRKLRITCVVFPSAWTGRWFSGSVLQYPCACYNINPPLISGKESCGVKSTLFGSCESSALIQGVSSCKIHTDTDTDTVAVCMYPLFF